MKITPLDILQMVFKVWFRGYEKEEVNRFPRAPGDDEAEDGEDYEVIHYQRAALWMGFFIVLCAAAMIHLHL